MMKQSQVVLLVAAVTALQPVARLQQREAGSVFHRLIL